MSHSDRSAGSNNLQLKLEQMQGNQIQLSHKIDRISLKAGRPIQLRNDIPTYGALANDCGTSMEVDLDGPQDYGSKPKEQPSWWGTMEKLSPTIGSFVQNYLVQGHLLNDNLGGPGEMKNLTPLTKSANTTMLKQYEEKIKTQVNTDGKKANYYVEPNYKGKLTAKELAGSKLSLVDQQLLDLKGYPKLFCDEIYAHYTLKERNGSETEKSKGIVVTNTAAGQ